MERGFGVVEGLEIGNITSAKAYEQKLILRKTAEKITDLMVVRAYTMFTLE